jgi:hypothetical protein
MKKRPRRKVSTPPPARRPAAPPEPVALHYKVVELSTVDETTLEETVNSWVLRGWTVESIHFAMRDSSKRPAMAFLFFTGSRPEAPPGTRPPPRGQPAAWERLAQLAADGESEP